MGHSLGRAARVTEWVFPAVHPSYDDSHPLLVRFPVAGVHTEAAALLLGRDLLTDEELPTLGSCFSSCVIYFHSNGCDIGQCVDDMTTFRDGVLDGDAVVLCPEYPGYGLLRAYEPSVAGINLVARAAWEYCRRELGFRPAQIMLWGRSIGTGPATELAHTLAIEAKIADACDHEMLLRELSTRSAGAGRSVPLALPTAGADAGAGPLLDERFTTPTSPSSGAPTGLPRVEIGMKVMIMEAFRSDSMGRVLLRTGERGRVVRIDEAGDVLVDFQDHPKSQWIFKANHSKMLFQAVEKVVGALVLLAPLTSVAAVIQHHVQSEFAASLVGPMWEVLEMAKDSAMENVPLFVIHPKNDEIVPSAHGQALFEQAACRQRFGVWLCNATHNIALDDDHLRIARNYFEELLGKSETREGAHRMLKLDGESGRCEGGEDGEVMCVANRLMQLGLEGKAEDSIIMSL